MISWTSGRQPMCSLLHQTLGLVTGCACEHGSMGSILVPQGLMLLPPMAPFNVATPVIGAVFFGNAYSVSD